jgi:hypothetical protein
MRADSSACQHPTSLAFQFLGFFSQCHKTFALLHVYDVPLPTIQPKYWGISARRKAETEAAIDKAFNEKDTEGLRWAICSHLSTNPELADRVCSEIMRKLPWHPCDRPLTPISGKTPCSHVVNYLAARRYRDHLRKDVWSRGGDVALDSYDREPLLYGRAEDEPAEHTLDDPKSPSSWRHYLRTSANWLKSASTKAPRQKVLWPLSTRLSSGQRMLRSLVAGQSAGVIAALSVLGAL